MSGRDERERSSLWMKLGGNMWVYVHNRSVTQALRQP